MVPDFAVDGKGANDMKSMAKLKKAKTKVTGGTRSGEINISKTKRALGKDKKTTYSPIGDGKVLAEITKTGRNKTKTKTRVVSEKKAARKAMKAVDKMRPAKTKDLREMTPAEIKKAGLDKKLGGPSATKLKKDKMNASKTVKLKKRNMYPGDAVFEGSEKSKVDQRITNNVVAKKDGKMVTGTKTSKTYTHYPEGHGSTKTEKAGKRTRVTEADGSTKVIKKRTFGGTKEFEYDAQGNLKSKIKRNRKGDITNAKGDNRFSNKKLRNKGRKTKDFSKKEKAALANVKTTYKG